MDPDKLAGLVEHLIAVGDSMERQRLAFLWSQGEAQYGRQNFMELLSVFTSPPLFKVLNGQKELGFVHESTFYNQKEGSSRAGASPVETGGHIIWTGNGESPTSSLPRSEVDLAGLAKASSSVTECARAFAEFLQGRRRSGSRT